MVADVLVPQMGESVLEGTILEWKVKVGDKIELNQTLVELMTDKVNIEIPAETAGVLTAQLAKEGDVVPVGTRIATIDDGNKNGDRPPESTVAAATPSASEKQHAQTSSGSARPKADVKGTADVGKGKLSPKVKMLLREYGIEPDIVIPTGSKGRVKVDDVMRAVEERSTASGFTAGPIPAPPLPSMPTMSPAPSEKLVEQVAVVPTVKVEIPKFERLPANLRETRSPLSGARKMIAEHMVMSKATSAHVTTFEDIDMTELVKWRSEIKSTFKATYGANLTYMPFILKACCVALKRFPALNASLTDKEIILKNYYNIGIAVAREEGLIVPVIKDADKKTIVELAVEIAELGDKARTNKLMPDDVSDGTFTLTNAGMFGATASTPIISQPQVAILGIHAITKKPWVVKNEIVVRDISSFGLSFDHRLIDGHTAVQFLHNVHEFLADTSRLLLNLR